MRFSRVVRASKCQCPSRNSSEIHPSFPRHGGSWGAADEAALNNAQKKTDEFECFGIVVVYGVHERHLGTVWPLKQFCGANPSSEFGRRGGGGDRDSRCGTPFAILTRDQCCGSGSGIRCPFDPWIRDQGWSGFRIRIRDEQLVPRISFPRALKQFFCVKIQYLNSLMRIRVLGWKKFGSGINIPDPQHCKRPEKIHGNSVVDPVWLFRIRVRGPSKEWKLEEYGTDWYCACVSYLP